MEVVDEAVDMADIDQLSMSILEPVGAGLTSGKEIDTEFSGIYRLTQKPNLICLDLVNYFQSTIILELGLNSSMTLTLILSIRSSISVVSYFPEECFSLN